VVSHVMKGWEQAQSEAMKEILAIVGKIPKGK